MASADSDDVTFLNTKKLKREMDITGGQPNAIRNAFVTREQLLDALRDGEDLTERDGIGKKTADALWNWFHNVHGETVDPDGTLVLDDEGLHLPDWLVGFVGTFTVETPTITIRPTTTDHGLGEVSDLIAAYPKAGTWNERLTEGQIALKAAGRERVYEIDDQRTDIDDGGDDGE